MTSSSRARSSTRSRPAAPSADARALATIDREIENIKVAVLWGKTTDTLLEILEGKTAEGERFQGATLLPVPRTCLRASPRC